MCTMTSRQRTLTREEVPCEVRVPAILTGYRAADQPWRAYFWSMFQLHNETVNIWTHLIGCMLVLYQTCYYYNLYNAANSELRWTTIGFGSCIFMTNFYSTVAHLIHSRSVYVNYIVFMFDYLGVVFWLFGTGYLALYGISDKFAYEFLGNTYLHVQFVCTYINFINIVFAKLWYSHDIGHSARKAMMLIPMFAQGFLNTAPFVPRYVSAFQSASQSVSSLTCLTLVLAIFVLLSVVYTLHQPEIMYPGRFDLFGQSHHLLHVLVVVNQHLQFRVMYMDFQNGNNTHCRPDVYTILLYVVLLNVVGAITIYYLRMHAYNASHKKKT